MTLPLPYGLVTETGPDGRERLDPAAVQGNFEALAMAALTRPPDIATTLASAPADGTEVYYQSAAMKPSGYVWHLKYRAASSSAYKWEYVGGPPMRAASVNSSGLIAAAYQFSASIRVTAPLAGEYDIVMTATGGNAATGIADAVFLDLALNGAGGVDANAAVFAHAASANAIASTVTKVAYNVAMTAGMTAGMCYRSINVQDDLSRRSITLIPVRVG